jgi:urea carboxylase
MKMEITVTAHVAGRVSELRAAPGRSIRAGDVLVVLEDAL